MMIAVLLALLFLTPISAASQIDSVSAAIEIVEDFHQKADGLLKGAAGYEQYQGFAAKEKEKILEELKSISWTEKPGARRYRRVYGVVESYADRLISVVESLKKEGRDAASIDETLKNLSTLKSSKMKELETSYKAETFERDKTKPVPLIDQPTYEESPQAPDESQGIWFR